MSKTLKKKTQKNIMISDHSPVIIEKQFKVCAQYMLMFVVASGQSQAGCLKLSFTTHRHERGIKLLILAINLIPPIFICFGFAQFVVRDIQYTFTNYRTLCQTNKYRRF